jgi:hypothetical protein
MRLSQQGLKIIDFSEIVLRASLGDILMPRCILLILLGLLLFDELVTAAAAESPETGNRATQEGSLSLQSAVALQSLSGVIICTFWRHFLPILGLLFKTVAN